MVAIDRPGTFRGKPLDWGVSETKNGFPQFTVKLQAQEYFNEGTGEYIDWSEYGQEITAYLVLYSLDKNGQWQELLNAKQIKAAFGWNGLDFESLANGRYEETTVLFRVEESEFNGNVSLKVTWLDRADADPIRQLPKFDAGKLRSLTAKLGSVLQGAAPTPAKAPVSAKGGKPVTPPTRGPGRPKSTPKDSPAAAPAQPAAAPSTATPPPASPAPAKPAPSGSPSEPETKESAWVAVNEMKAKDVTDEKLADVWINAASAIGKTEDRFTSEDWATVKNAVLKEVSVF